MSVLSVAVSNVFVGVINPFWRKNGSILFSVSNITATDRMTTAVATMTPRGLYEYEAMMTDMLEIPDSVRAVIAGMEALPVAPVYVRRAPAAGVGRVQVVRVSAADAEASWRRSTIHAIRNSTRQKDDLDYEKIIAIVNKIVDKTLADKTAEVVGILETRDEEFRVRIVNFIFDRGVCTPFYAKLLASLIKGLCASIPAVEEDIAIFCSIDTFNVMFGGETIPFPKSTDDGYDDKVCAWHKHREIRRGFGVFALELFSQGIVSEEMIADSIKTAIEDLEDAVCSDDAAVKTEMSERADQIVNFMTEVVKVVGNHVVKTQIEKILTVPKATAKCLGMRSRFRLEDLLKGKVK